MRRSFSIWPSDWPAAISHGGPSSLKLNWRPIKIIVWFDFGGHGKHNQNKLNKASIHEIGKGRAVFQE